MDYFAKSPNSRGHQETVMEHLRKVAALAKEYGEPIGLGVLAWLAGQMHDFGKYTQAFQDVLKGLRTGGDHAIGGACLLEAWYHGNPGSRPVIEAVNGHHDGLVEYDAIRGELHAIADENETACGNAGKTPPIGSGEELAKAFAAFRRDFLDFRPPKSLPVPPATELESMPFARGGHPSLWISWRSFALPCVIEWYSPCLIRTSFSPWILPRTLVRYISARRGGERSLNSGGPESGSPFSIRF